ncbi:Gly d Jun a 3-like protein [Dinothrombium tinctorium]|uniref:limulus clotting factor C n=1 Tax=Dinothrombium tinctorium TaxID=1965070 RepID=A0A3S3RWW6_9ACAR|nr:Gly d Jun a 3-like protein [Dinothrombium tinctorium]RWS07242.1 Gly d Jun a 3-like protein [Dinothrombium tinctorium]RWS12079.1 Gly d Jun a 3-like protein [Dinothrombium tinctorium]
MIFLLLIFLVFEIVHINGCGYREQINDRIVGGRAARRNEFPWTVALERFDGDEFVHFCGATILSERWLITAAHCLYGRNLKDIRGVLGITELNHKDGSTFITKFSKAYVHQAFSYTTLENDIALLYTEKEIPFSSSINAICLPKHNAEFSGKAIVSGWGVINEPTKDDESESESSEKLKVLEINLYSDYDCRSLLGRKFKDLIMICAGFIKGTADACQGDSGGPLEKVIDKRSYLIGIVSFGEGCGRELLPGIYTEVSYFIPWILKITNIKQDISKGDQSSKKANPSDHHFEVINRCSFTVWMSSLGNWGKSTPANGGFELGRDQRANFTVDKGWVGRFWGRTDCKSGRCSTGDCGKGRAGCQGAGGIPPATLVEMALDVDGVKDTYSISLIDGFNLPMEVKPIANTFRYTSNSNLDCKPAGCYRNINKYCPDELAIKRNKRIVACRSACLRFQSDQFCCRGTFAEQNQCLDEYSSTKYLTPFTEKCPDAKSLIFDNWSKVYSCKSDPVTHYEITFCPVN